MPGSRIVVSAVIALIGMGFAPVARALDLGGQEALVVASRATEADVVAFLGSGAVARENLPPAFETRVYLSQNGWYAIAIGLFPPAQCENRLSRLVRRNAIPGDSYCSSGERYVAEFMQRGNRLVLLSGIVPKGVVNVDPAPRLPAPVAEPEAEPVAATAVRDAITGTRWSLFEGACSAESVNYQEFSPAGYSVTIRGERSTGETRVTVFDVDEVSGEFRMEYETYSPMQSAPWSIVTVDGRLLPDGRLATEEVIRTTTLETLGAARPSYDSVVETATLSPCVGVAPVAEEVVLPAITILPRDIGRTDGTAGCQEVFDGVRRSGTEALNLTAFVREGETWRWQLVPTERCLSDQTNLDLGLCDIPVEGGVRVVPDKPGLVVTYTAGSCTFESRLSGVRGVVDVVTTARGEATSGRPCMDGPERAQALVCLDGP